MASNPNKKLERRIARQIQEGALNPGWKGEKVTRRRIEEALDNFSIQITETTHCSIEEIAHLRRSLEECGKRQRPASCLVE